MLVAGCVLNLLIVDDHRLLRDGLKLTLQGLEENVTIFEAGNGEDAIPLIENHEFDIVLIDFHLPDTTGVSLLSQIKSLSPETPAVVMSGSEEPALIRSVLDAGSSGFLPKSLDSADILDAVNLILQGEIYVPPFIAETLEENKLVLNRERSFDYSDLLHMAQITQQAIEGGDWSVRAKSQDANRPESVNAFNRLLDKVEQQYNLLREHAFTDPLTGLPNRRLFDDRMDQALEYARRNQKHMALVAMDLDRFKQINDTLGHDQGDLLLKIIAERLSELTRKVDTVSRLGGDEFVVILTELSGQAALFTAIKRLMNGLTRPASLGGELITPSVSMGVAVSDGTDDPETIFKRADEALYEVKHAGRNGYRIFGYSDEQGG